VDQHPYTADISKMIKANTSSGDVYVHLGDADAMDLRVLGTNEIDVTSIFGKLEMPMFTGYDKIIQNLKDSARGKKPAIVSGGYRFQVSPAVGGADQLRAIANQMDQEFRQAVGQIDPRVLYFPEPNTLVKLQGDKIEVSFGVGYKEGETMMKSLIEKRSLQEKHLVWDNSAGLTTLGDRFGAKLGDKEVNGQVMAYSGGVMTGKGITLEQFTAMFKADQMHATRSKFVSRIIATNRYPALTGKEDRQSAVLESAYNILFPHTSILGAKMRNKVNWMNIKTLLPTTTPSSAAATALSTLSQAYDPAIAAQLLALMSAGAEAVHAYMTKLFASNDPK
jgi:hypothetical protein